MIYEVACYYFGNYHQDKRNALVHGPGWTEWELVKRAESRIPGMRQPRVPAWGYDDEANPADMARKIDAAADHGITSFIFDWYWYDDGPFLERALDEGFLNAPNRDRLKFAIMWANHDWMDIHPAKARQPQQLLYPGKIRHETWQKIIRRMVDTYFAQPNYWKINGKPYFSIYDLRKFVESAGSIDVARQWLDEFRDLTRQAGHPDLHLDLILFEARRAAERAKTPVADVVRALGADSLGSYVWVHHQPPKWPTTKYGEVREELERQWPAIAEEFAFVPTIPNVTQGWDASPRCCQSDVYRDLGYPWIGIYADNTPAEFELALRSCRRFIDARPGQPKILTLNAWNEWTEGSYLEPDTVWGMQYLEAVKRVFW